MLRYALTSGGGINHLGVEVEVECPGLVRVRLENDRRWGVLGLGRGRGNLSSRGCRRPKTWTTLMPDSALEHTHAQSVHPTFSTPSPRLAATEDMHAIIDFDSGYASCKRFFSRYVVSPCSVLRCNVSIPRVKQGFIFRLV